MQKFIVLGTVLSLLVLSLLLTGCSTSKNTGPPVPEVTEGGGCKEARVLFPAPVLSPPVGCREYTATIVNDGGPGQVVVIADTLGSFSSNIVSELLYLKAGQRQTVAIYVPNLLEQYTPNDVNQNYIGGIIGGIDAKTLASAHDLGIVIGMTLGPAILITPTSAGPGTQITINGFYFTPQATISEADISCNQVPFAGNQVYTVDGTGKFTITLTLPSSATGDMFYIEVTDSSGKTGAMIVGSSITTQ